MTEQKHTSQASRTAASVGPGSNSKEKSHHRWIIFVTGPTACGKTTIAKYLAEQIHAKYLEGDDFHPKANIEKMHRGEPLTDEDRSGWLQAIEDHASAHPSGPGTHHLVVMCSALKHEYREALREGSRRAADVRVGFIFLDAPEDVLTERARQRRGHYAGANLVHSQFVILERPGRDEEDVVTVDVNQPEEEAEQEALRFVKKMLDS